MKKFKRNTFITIFLILTFFVVTILSINLFQTYYNQKEDIKRALERKVPVNPNPDFKGPMILDYDVYNVIIEEDDEIEIINFTGSDEKEDDIEELVEDILESNQEYKIGNLFFNHYAYELYGNELKIIDISYQSKRLLAYLILNIVILIASEIIIYFVSKLLTRWITKPVSESFQKQKDFVADASHELKTPLAVIMASVDAYETDKKQKWLNNIKSESERMNMLVTNLLDLAKTENDKERLMQKENFSELVENSILTFESLFYDNKKVLKENIQKDIKLLCNKDDIKELLSILLDNAIKHSKKNVVVNLFQKGKEITLEVINDGEKILKGDEEKIFERFYKADKSRERKDNNYGLGLAIAKNIVINNKGDIKAYSDEKVTTFKVTWNQK